MKWILKGIMVVLVIALFALGLGWVTMRLWNWLMPAIFGLTMITFWQAVGLLVLSKILFSGFRKGGHHRAWRHHKHGYWRKRWEDKMAKMTPEQREKFIQGMQKCRWGGPPWAHGWEPDETKGAGQVPGEKS